MNQHAENQIGKRILVSTLVLFLICYAGSYLYLSMNGKYVPGNIKLWGVTSYIWAPRGLVSEETGKWSPISTYFYHPLWICDHRFWHKETPAHEIERQEDP